MGINITEIIDGTTTNLSATAKRALAHDWADFPAELRQKLRRLYDLYDQSDFYCSAVDEESVHQAVLAELRYPTRDDNPIDMLDGRTLKGIQNIFKKGLGSTYFRAGDYFDITIPTRVALLSGGVINAGSTWRVVCLGIDHNPELEGYNRGHFALGRNTDNVGGDCNVADNVTATVDNLWFLAVFETGTAHSFQSVRQCRHFLAVAFARQRSG